MPILLARIAAWCGRHIAVVFVASVLLALGSAWLATHRLGMTTDTDQMFSNSLPWKQRQAALARDFPQFQDLLVAVVDGQVPEEAEETARDLADRLSQDHVHFRSVRRPDASPYLRKEGFLFLDQKELSSLLNRIIDAQPFIGQLVGDPSARGLFSALSLVAMGVEHGQADLSGFATPLRGFHATLQSVLAGQPKPLSWQNLLGGGLAEKAGPYRFVLIQPKLDYGTLAPGGVATAAVRQAAADLPFVRAGLAHVRITGQVALSDDEFSSVAQGAAEGLIGSLVLVTLWLFLAVRSWRVVVPIVLTLLLGLLLTAGFATIAVGRLNLISVAFAILFVGIAVDFAIQFSVRFREQQGRHPAAPAALAETGRRAGVQIMVASAATAAGFLAFVPTAFIGVAELGLIAGCGMLIAFAVTLTFLPACLALFRPRPAGGEIGYAWARRLDAPLARHRRVVLAGAALLALAGAASIPWLQFDADPLDTQNPHTEAMRTLRDLMSSPITNPYSVDVMLPNAEQAGALADRLRKLPLVASAMTLMSYVPDDQKPKLALIADANSILAPTLTAASPAAAVTPSDLRLAVHTAAQQLGRAAEHLKPDDPLSLVASDIARLQDAPDATLLAMNQVLTEFLPMQLDQLRLSLDAAPVTVASIPPDIARDWVLPNGQARVNALAATSAQGSSGLHAFVAQVLTVAPSAGGSAVTIVETSNTIINAFRDAAIGAIVAIALILLAVLRRVKDAAMVLAPLLLSALLTALIAVLAPLRLNFANIIALPLLLGVGVSFNIYFVMNWRAGLDNPLGSPTARAVLFSALTTGTAFGSLALSAHPGTASMGDLLLLSLGCTLASTMVFVPALLAAVRR